MNRILDFKPEGLKKIHFFMEGLSKPVAIAAYTDQENQLVSSLHERKGEDTFNTEAICQWCRNHQLQYRLF